MPVTVKRSYDVKIGGEPAVIAAARGLADFVGGHGAVKGASGEALERDGFVTFLFREQKRSDDFVDLLTRLLRAGTWLRVS